jgi:Flp pilus assembly protein TadD
VDALIRLAITQQDLGQIHQAIETFRRAVELKPQHVDLHYRLALLYTDGRQFAQAVEQIEQAAGLAPDNPQVRAALALSLQNMGLADRAAAVWRGLGQVGRQAAAE